MALRDRVGAVVDGKRFRRLIIAVIVVNAIALGCETSPALVAANGGLLTAVDHTLVLQELRALREEVRALRLQPTGSAD
jgi:voltage-gated sodium channel